MEKNFKLAGVTFEGRKENIDAVFKTDRDDVKLVLIREKDNKYDSNAVRIEAETNGSTYDLGYIPKYRNGPIAEKLDNNEEVKITNYEFVIFENEPVNIKLTLEY